MRTKVLLVDDEPDIVETTEYVLLREGFEVVTATNGVEAIDAVRRHHPDVVLLDVMLPGENGYRVARTIRDDERAGTLGRRTAIILVTARDLSMDAEGEREFKRYCEPDLVIYKPFDIDDLLLLMEKVLRNVGRASP